MLLGLADVGAPAQLALCARRLRSEVVAQISLLPLDAALGRQLEALLRAAVGLHLVLGHGRRGSISISRLWARVPWLRTLIRRRPAGCRRSGSCWLPLPRRPARTDR